MLQILHLVRISYARALLYVYDRFSIQRKFVYSCVNSLIHCRFFQILNVLYLIILIIILIIIII